MEGAEEVDSRPASKVSEEEEGRVTTEEGRFQLSLVLRVVVKCRKGGIIMEHNHTWKRSL